MGSSSSKGIRKLPKSALPQSARGQRVRLPQQAPPPPIEEQPEEESSGPIDYSRLKEEINRGQSAKGTAIDFSGEKDDALQRDAMDPQFLQNLHKLGPVEIKDAGKFIPADFQRTLSSRKDIYTSSSQLAPPGHLTLPFLVNLLDKLKTLPPGADPTPIYKQFGVEKEKMDVLRKWVNSVSVEDEDYVTVDEGNEVREMKSVWIGGLKK
ncbi:hypothetical protein L202_02961 [Cryptococcus amylolentus CBS 6039]|uniref:Uncharacterized protein n=1 Tax=Cryptococcus amylolentus CBS 6039 TaxID=1295533 RepID=A0A1E3HZ11_9TREE|nr:hypothetical protein L202_02961 [Cryptococcus amylolentus CBS 6039]ODN80811.1 hypothetical protein L202_02961 [Cryptococcus amylolentus CBS 6039]